MIDMAIANIMAVVAALAIQAEMNAVTAPNATRIRPGPGADPGQRQDAKRQPAVEAVEEDGPGAG